MHFSRELIAAIVKGSPKLVASTKRRNLARSIQILRTRLSGQIESHMQPWMVLLDESVSFLINFEQYLLSKQHTAATSAFALQVSKLRSVSLSIRELVALGQEAPAAALLRILVEDIELAMALADDAEFALAYSEAEETEAFWRKHIGFGKLAPKVTSFLTRAGLPESGIARYLENHRDSKSALSSHVHTANHSAFRSGAVPSLTQRGMIALGGMGALSAHFPRLCMSVAEETHIFATACIKVFTRPEPPPALADFTPAKLLSDAVVSAHVLQHLLIEHGDKLSIACDDFFGEIEVAG
jgi:hypothetical protein